MKYITGKKIEMSQIFDEQGNVIPVTLILSEQCNELKQDQKVKITSISKAKGFQGVVKRWGFKGSPASHGTKHGLRAPGSIGSSFPERVWKGKKMGGRMGSKKVTIKTRVVKIDEDNKQIMLKGAVPGRAGALIKIVYES